MIFIACLELKRKKNIMLEINTIYSDLSLTELAQNNGGGILSSVAGLVKDTWGTLYSTGRDFDRSVVNAAMP